VVYDGRVRVELIAAADAPAAMRAALADKVEREFGHVEIVRTHVWAEPTWLMLGHDGVRIVSFLSIVDRRATADDGPLHLFGLSNVITEPEARGRGHSFALNQQALAFMAEQDRVAIGLLFCADDLVRFYARLGWQRFAGRVTVEQPSGDRPWTSNCMVHGLGRTPPAAEHIHLRGLPW
jgi:predicted GNAT family N-acyltransferase